MVAECNAAAEAWLTAETSLADDERDRLGRLACRLAERPRTGEAGLLGIGGAPGTGKSTLARLVAHLAGAVVLGASDVVPTFVLSLDDYYLSRDERRRLARRVHPLLAQRGVPGTHDVTRLFEDLDRLRGGTTGPCRLPRFDKGTDDRDPRDRRIHLDGRPSRVFLEGWFVGTPPEDSGALETPVNALEAMRDPDGTCRRWVNNRLADIHARLDPQLGERWHLAAPDWESVLAFRWRQEADRPPERRLLLDPAATAKFLAPFERLCRHQFAHAGDWADVLIRLDRRHRPRLQCPP